jgi:hypothetical protein
MRYGLPSDWVQSQFRDYLHRCELTLSEVFNQSGRVAVDLRAWLFETNRDDVSMEDTIYIEALYTVAMFLGFDQGDVAMRNYEALYQRLSADRRWLVRRVHA